MRCTIITFYNDRYLCNRFHYSSHCIQVDQSKLNIVSNSVKLQYISVETVRVVHVI